MSPSCSDPSGNELIVRRGAFVLLLLIASRVMASPITFLTALPVAEHQGVLRVQYLRVRGTDDPTPLNRKLTVDAVPIVLAAGLSSRLAVFVALPYIDKSLDVNTPLGRRTRGSSGIGDALLLARYTAIAVDEPGATLRIDPFIALKTPTGAHRRSDALGRLPQPLQPGTGSWDELAGVALTRQKLAWEFDADAAYRHNGEANDFRFGNEALADASFQYRLWPRRLAEETPSFIYGVVESNLDWRGRNEPFGIRDPGSGGTSIDIDVGVQYVREKYIIEAAIRRPVVQNLRAEELKRDYEVTAGFRWNFTLPFGSRGEEKNK